MTPLPASLEVVVEVPRGGRVKRRADGRLDYASPLPAPFNYGSAPGREGGDGDPLDVVVLGPRLSRGSRLTAPVRGVVRFEDAGARDDKVVCSASPPTRAELRRVRRFFLVYAVLKGALNRARGHRGPTRFLGWDPR